MLFSNPREISISLTIISVSKIGFIQAPLWNNAKMNGLRNIKGLDGYYARYDVSWYFKC